MKMEFNKIFIFLFQIYINVVKPQARSCDSYDTLLTNGRISDGDTFWETKSTDAVECARLCIRMVKCKSFNFNKKVNICQLNSETGSHSQLDKDSVFSTISRWPSQIDLACYQRQCLNDETCVPQKSSANFCSFSCMKMGTTVKCPPFEGTLSSQPRTVGSVYVHECPRGSVGGDSALCLLSGKWNKTIDKTCAPLFGLPCDSDVDCDPINGVCVDHVCSCEKTSRYDSKGLACVRACDEGWVWHGEKCYYIGEEKMDHIDAKSFCNDKGGQLVQIDTAEENTFLKTTMAALNLTDNDYWTDMYQVGKNGEEIWLTSNDSVTFTDWYGEEPDDLYGPGIIVAERCTVMRKNHGYKWVDFKCTSTQNVLCQMPVKK